MKDRRAKKCLPGEIGEIGRYVGVVAKLPRVVWCWRGENNFCSFGEEQRSGVLEVNYICLDDLCCIAVGRLSAGEVGGVLENLLIDRGTNFRTF
jgi:hypothetical protein